MATDTSRSVPPTNWREREVREPWEDEVLVELVDGEPMSAAEPIAVLREVAGVLAHAHARGIIHRALRPDLIVIADGAVDSNL